MQVIEFTKKIEENEDYAECGMLATVLEVEDMGDDCLRIEVSYDGFEEHNAKFETHDYFNRNHEAVLSAREAGMYNIRDSLYVDADAWRNGEYCKVI